MRKKQLLAASVVLIILVVLSLLSRDKKSTSNISPGDIVFENVKESDLDRLQDFKDRGENMAETFRELTLGKPESTIEVEEKVEASE